jgi:hypothetical protein
VILLLNGAFGVGKTTVARALVARLPRAVLFDPELIGMVLQRAARLVGRRVDDFQDFRSWRRLTVLGLRVTRLFRKNVVVPMAFSNAEHLREIREGLGPFEPAVVHVCLVAPVEVVHERLRMRGLDPVSAPWEFRRAVECCVAHQGEKFGVQVSAEGTVADIVEVVLASALRDHRQA